MPIVRTGKGSEMIFRHRKDHKEENPPFIPDDGFSEEVSEISGEPDAIPEETLEDWHLETDVNDPDNDAGLENDPGENPNFQHLRKRPNLGSS